MKFEGDSRTVIDGPFVETKELIAPFGACHESRCIRAFEQEIKRAEE